MIFKGYLYIIIAAGFWGMIGPLSRLAFTEGITPMEVAFWRAVIAWLFFGGHAILAKEYRVSRRDIPNLVLFGVLGVTCFYGSYQLAVNMGGAALAAVLLYTAPVWVAIMSRFFLKERMTRVKLVALALTLSGVACVSLGPGGTGIRASLPAILFGLSSGFCYALYYIFGKHFSGRYSSPNIFLYILPLGAVGLIPWTEFAHKSPTAWIVLICLAFFCTYCAYYSYYLGLKHLEATRAAITATLEPVIAAVVAYFWWGEYFSSLGYAGSFLILSSVVLMVWDGYQ